MWWNLFHKYITTYVNGIKSSTARYRPRFTVKMSGTKAEKINETFIMIYFYWLNYNIKLSILKIYLREVSPIQVFTNFLTLPALLRVRAHVTGCDINILYH